MKKLLLGNEAVARGLYESGVSVISSYPGTPSTEITEYASLYDEMYSEWAPNEKVAAEVAVGASLAGARAFCGMKHVGLNVAADPLYTASYIGVLGGLVIGVADDPGMHSSQNEQDSRHHAIASKMPMLEPSDSAECLAFTKLAYDLSEQFDTPVFLRLTTRIAHSRSVAEESSRQDVPLKEYKKNPAKNVMMPAMAKARHVEVEKRMLALAEWAEIANINTVEINHSGIGVITAGDCYHYAKEALGNRVSYLKLGIVNPLPVKLIKDFASKFGKVYVIEELDPIIENHCKQLGIKVIGKELFSLMSEFSQQTVKENILGETAKLKTFNEKLPTRPPVLCAGCPHRGLFYALKALDLFVSGDIGCYTLSALLPLGALDTCICMGASVSAMHGAGIARGEEFSKKAVAVIGDSTFIHSGITGMIDIIYNKGISNVIVLDNSITGMTGHQHNPANGFTLKNEPTDAVDLEALAYACGFKRVRTIDPYKINEVLEVLKEELNDRQPSFIISKRPCALLKSVKSSPALNISGCKSCKMCMKIGCPAISFKENKAIINHELCVGCSVCTEMCKFGCISKR